MAKNMAVIQATDEDLRDLLYEHDCVIVKYINEDCEYCKAMAPPYEKFSSSKKYQGITFLKVDSGENPVAKEEVGNRDMPFFSTFKKGLLIECGSIRTEKGIIELLDRLVAARRADSQ